VSLCDVADNGHFKGAYISLLSAKVGAAFFSEARVSRRIPQDSKVHATAMKISDLENVTSKCHVDILMMSTTILFLVNRDANIVFTACRQRTVCDLIRARILIVKRPSQCPPQSAQTWQHANCSTHKIHFVRHNREASCQMSAFCSSTRYRVVP
jgi:hypothetical protein